MDTFTFQTFEPRGVVEGHPNIKMSNSIIDYVFRSLGVEYLERDDLAQVPPNRSGDLPEPPEGLAVEAGMQLDLTDAAMESDIDAQVAAAKFVDAEVVAVPSTPVGSAPPNGTEPLSGAAAVTAALSGAAAVTAALNGGATQAAVATVAAEYSLSEMMGDAPACQGCGHMTVRNGSCFVCLTCGDTTGCS